MYEMIYFAFTVTKHTDQQTGFYIIYIPLNKLHWVYNSSSTLTPLPIAMPCSICLHFPICLVARSQRGDSGNMDGMLKISKTS